MIFIWIKVKILKLIIFLEKNSFKLKYLLEVDKIQTKSGF